MGKESLGVRIKEVESFREGCVGSMDGIFLLSLQNDIFDIPLSPSLLQWNQRLLERNAGRVRFYFAGGCRVLRGNTRIYLLIIMNDLNF